MRPVVKDNIAIFTLQGFVDSSFAESFLGVSDFQYVNSLKVKGIFISLKNVIFFNKKGIESLMDLLERFKKERLPEHVMVGFCNYTPDNYKIILNMFDKSLKIDLIKDEIGLSLFIGDVKLKQKNNIIVYSDDSTQKSTMVIRLYERDIKCIAPSTRVEYLELKESNEYEYILDNTYLGDFASGFSSQKVGNTIIYKFDGFIDAKSIDVFDLMYHQHSLNIGFKFFVFDFEKVKSINVHGVSFIAKISIAAAEYGATVAIAHMDQNSTGKPLVHELEDSGIIFFDTVNEFLNEISTEEVSQDGGLFVVKYNRVLTKKLITNLPIIVNACVHSLNILTNTKATKKYINIQNLNIDKEIDKSDLIATSIGFYGELEGMAILVLSRSIAKKASELFVGEQMDSDEELYDAMGEFVNIIGGQTKSMLSAIDIKINITLPNMFENIESLESSIKEKKGVEVLLYFDNEPFYLYVTR